MLSQIQELGRYSVFCYLIRGVNQCNLLKQLFLFLTETSDISSLEDESESYTSDTYDTATYIGGPISIGKNSNRSLGE